MQIRLDSQSSQLIITRKISDNCPNNFFHTRRTAARPLHTDKKMCSRCNDLAVEVLEVAKEGKNFHVSREKYDLE
jgi:hypothetical protein